MGPARCRRRARVPDVQQQQRGVRHVSTETIQQQLVRSAKRRRLVCFAGAAVAAVRGRALRNAPIVDHVRKEEVPAAESVDRLRESQVDSIWKRMGGENYDCRRFPFTHTRQSPPSMRTSSCTHKRPHSPGTL